MAEVDILNEEAQRLGLPESIEEPEPDFDDPEDYVDDISNEGIVLFFLFLFPSFFNFIFFFVFFFRIACRYSQKQAHI